MKYLIPFLLIPVLAFGQTTIKPLTQDNIESAITDDAGFRTEIGLGTAATADTGTGAGNIPVLDGSGRLPAVDGSQLTGISGSTGYITPTGLVSDARRRSDGVVSGTSLTSATASFAASGEVGKTIRIEGAGTPASCTFAVSGNKLAGGISNGTMTKTANGSGWAIGDTFTITGGGGSGSVVTVTAVSSGGITGFNVTTPGTGYTSAPTGVTKLTGASTVNPTFTFNADNFIVYPSDVTPGSVGAYVPNSIFAVTVSGGSPSTAATVNAYTDENGQVAYVRLANVGAGYGSTPTATFPTADHITTIAARVSATQITLTDSAPTAIGSGAIFFYGTDNTTAIQAAIDEAYTSTTTREVSLPVGSYLCNIKMRQGVTLRGVNSVHTQDPQPSDTYFNSNIGTPVGVQLVGATRAPVIDTDPTAYGASYNCSQTVLSNIAIIGSTNKRGFGVRYGVENGVNTGYVGAQFLVDRLFISGFEYGISINRVSNLTVQHCEIGGCTVGYNFGGSTLLGVVGGTDGVNMVACQGHGNTTTVRFSGSKNATISDCDFGGSTGAFVQNNAVAMETSIVTINSMNVERIEQEIVKKTNGILTINNVHILSTTTSQLVGEYGVSTQTSIHNVTGLPGLWGATSAIPVLWRGSTSVSGGTGWPTIAPHLGGVMQKYADTTWASLREVHRVQDYFAPQPLFRVALRDEFMSYYGTSSALGPWAQLGWYKTNLGTSDYTVSYNQGKSGLQFAATANAATCFARLDVVNSSLYQPSFDLEFCIESENWSVAVARIGLWSLGATLAPSDGIGLRVDRSLGSPDTNYMLEIRSGGSVVATADSGVAYASARRFIRISRNSQGNHITVYDANYNPLGTASVNASLPAVYVTPAIYSGVTGANWGKLWIGNYRLVQR